LSNIECTSRKRGARGRKNCFVQLVERTNANKRIKHWNRQRGKRKCKFVSARRILYCAHRLERNRLPRPHTLSVVSLKLATRPFSWPVAPDEQVDAPIGDVNRLFRLIDRARFASRLAARKREMKNGKTIKVHGETSSLFARRTPNVVVGVVSMIFFVY
jgi:hypothetical protein